jgi:hypothetical protein
MPSRWPVPKRWPDAWPSIRQHSTAGSAAPRVTPQPGGFYGGWITPELVGPFKGEPGSEHW